MTQHNSGKRKKAKRKPEKLEFVQDFIPIKDLRHGIIQTTDGIITNIAHVTRSSKDPIIKHLIEELNESYDAIKELREHLEEI